MLQNITPKGSTTPAPKTTLLYVLQSRYPPGKVGDRPSPHVRKRVPQLPGYTRREGEGRAEGTNYTWLDFSLFDFVASWHLSIVLDPELNSVRCCVWSRWYTFHTFFLFFFVAFLDFQHKKSVPVRSGHGVQCNTIEYNTMNEVPQHTHFSRSENNQTGVTRIPY